MPTKVFRCPLAGWDKIECHMVVDSGTKGLVSWRKVERDLAGDYAAHIGGPAKAISHIWLLAVTPFQRRRGACRYADIKVATVDGATHKCRITSMSTSCDLSDGFRLSSCSILESGMRSLITFGPGPNWILGDPATRQDRAVMVPHLLRMR